MHDCRPSRNIQYIKFVLPPLFFDHQFFPPSKQMKADISLQEPLWGPHSLWKNTHKHTPMRHRNIPGHVQYRLVECRESILIWSESCYVGAPGVMSLGFRLIVLCWPLEPESQAEAVSAGSHHTAVSEYTSSWKNSF